MHEFSLVDDLMRKVSAIAPEEGASRISSVKAKLGALVHISREHFREAFEQAALGTPVAEAPPTSKSNPTRDPHAQDILLQGVDVEDE
jgi:hydrogenase nickel incorporation protein HypA/HybF